MLVGGKWLSENPTEQGEGGSSLPSGGQSLAGQGPGELMLFCYSDHSRLSAALGASLARDPLHPQALIPSPFFLHTPVPNVTIPPHL